MFVELIRFGGQRPTESRRYPIGNQGYCVLAASGALFPADMQLEGSPEYAVFGRDDQAAWLANHCTSLACCVNGHPVASGARHRLQEGDTIEIGVACLTVGALVAVDAATLASAQSAVAPADPTDFSDLAALAGPDIDTGPPDFSDLIALAGDYVEEGYGPEELLADREPLALLDHTAAARAGTPSPSDSAEEADPLATLSAEYRRALLHGERSQAHDLKAEATARATARIPADPFLDAPERFAEGSLLDDLLGDKQNIDTVLAELDDFNGGQLFEQERSHEILALLAPRGLAGQHVTQTALLARQEHHLISVDSNFHLSGASQPLSESQHDDHA